MKCSPKSFYNNLQQLREPNLNDYFGFNYEITYLICQIHFATFRWLLFFAL